MELINSEFNERWKRNLESGYKGLTIDIPLVVEYLHHQFTFLVGNIKDFKYREIKIFNSRVVLVSTNLIVLMGHEIGRGIEKTLEGRIDQLIMKWNIEQQNKNQRKLFE